MTFALLATLVLGGQDLTQKVTFAAPAGRASVILPQIAKQAGLNLELAPQTKDEVLFVRVKDVPLSDLMSRLAKVCDAEWKPETGGFRLIRSTDALKRAEQREFADRQTYVDQALSAATAKIAELPPFDEAQAKKLAEQQRAMQERMMQSGPSGGTFRISGARDIGSEAPSGRVIIGLLGQIGSARLAKIGEGDRVVFATNATSTQVTMPPAASQLLTRFVQDQKMYAEAYKKTQDPDRQIMIIGAGGGDMGPGNPSLGIGKGILAVTRRNEQLQASLTVADPNGDTISTGTYFLTRPTRMPANGNDKAPQAIAPSELTKELAKTLGTEIGTVIGGPRRSILRIANGSGPATTFSTTAAAGPKTPISAALRERLLNPERFDPQGLAVTEALDAVATQTGKNVVASVPDSAIVPLTRSLANEALSVEKFLGESAEGLGVSPETDASFVTLAPRRPITSMSGRINRPALGKLARKLNQGNLRLDEMAEFASQQIKPVGFAEIDGVTLSLINPGMSQHALNHLSDPGILRFYASLDPGQRAELGAGRPISLAALKPNQTAILAREVFHSMEGPSVQRPRQDGAPRMLSLFGGDVKTERTQVLPMGIPRDGTLAVSVERSTAALASDPKTGASEIVTPSALAMRMYGAEKPEMSFLGGGAKYDQFQVAEHAQYTFTFNLAPNVTLTRSLEDDALDPKSPKVTYNQLPAEFRDLTAKALDGLRKGLTGLGMSRGRPVPPTP